MIYEVTPTGDIAWKWRAGDHLDEFGFTPEALQLVRKSDHPDYLHVNDMRPVGPNHWFRDGDARFGRCIHDGWLDSTSVSLSSMKAASFGHFGRNWSATCRSILVGWG